MTTLERLAIAVVLAATRWFAVINCPPLIASVLPSAMVPPARLPILRSLPTEPMDTVLATFATELEPNATASAALTLLLKPSARPLELAKLIRAWLPIAMPLAVLAST